MINEIDRLIRIETRRAIKAILESKLSKDGDDERQQQKQQKNAIAARDLKASAAASKKDEADEEDEKSSDNKKEKEKAPDQKRDDRTKGRGTADSPKMKEPKKEQLKNPSLQAVIDKLNVLRGGRSLKDPDVRKSFSQYYSGLTTPEKQSLIIFLSGIAQVLAGSETGTEAIDPGDVGLRVKNTKDTADREEQKDQTNKKGTEENPIIVGEVSSKSKILKALKEYSKYQ